MTEWNFLCNDVNNSFLIDCREKIEYQRETLEDAYYFPFIQEPTFSDFESLNRIYNSLLNVLDLFKKSQKKRIVIFDEGIGRYSARFLYLLRIVGCRESYIYNKGWDTLKERTFIGKNIIEFKIQKTNSSLPQSIDKEFIKKNLVKIQLFDVRTLEEYKGKIPHFINPKKGEICGRLPGAFLWDWREFYSSDGLISDSDFKKKLETFPFKPERVTVIYDYDGSFSSLLALMLIEVGFLNVFVYQGSWFEWKNFNLPKQSYSIYKNENFRIHIPRVGGIKKI